MKSQTRIKPWLKRITAVSAVVGGGLAYAWFTSSPPRSMWFEQETVTVTKTVAPWWTGALTVVALALLVWAMHVAMVIGPRGFR